MTYEHGDIDEITKLVVEGSDHEVQSFLGILHPADIADLVETLDEAGRRRVLGLLDPKALGEVFSEVEDPYLEKLVERIHLDDLTQIVSGMETDDAVDFLIELPRENVEAILNKLDEEEGAEIGELLDYPEDSAGGIMQTELVSLPMTLTVEEAIAEIRRQAHEVRSFRNVYIVDAAHKLVGVLSLRNLLLADPDDVIETVMNPNVVKARVDMDQEDVADLVRRYDLVSVPVEDKDGKLVGRITVDDVVDVLDEEADEDFLMMAGSMEEDLFGGFLHSVLARFPWLLLTWVGALLNSVLIASYLHSYDELVLFVPFLPLILGMGGNVGGQSAIVVVRGIATGKLDSKKMWSVSFKEMKVGLALGLIYGVMLGGFALIMKKSALTVALIMGLSLTIQLSFAATSGVLLPIIFHRLKADPALATSPFISTIMDIFGASIYFTLAIILLGR